MIENPNLEIGLTHVKEQVSSYLDAGIRETSQLYGGLNNRVFKVTSEDNRSFILKLYFKDERRRLQRESGAYEFLRKNGIEDVPKVFFKNEQDYFALYSFEDGSKKTGADLTIPDLDLILSFITRVQEFKHTSQVSNDVGDALFSTRSLIEVVNGPILFRIKEFEKYIKSPNVNSKTREFEKNSDISKITRARLSKIESNAISNEKLYYQIDPSQIRLSPVDFGPQNMIFRKSGSICFIDFEYFGWDDPVKLIPSFLTHEATKGLTPEKQAYFIGKYRNISSVPQNILDRLDVTLQVSALNWITVLLWGFTPEKINSRRYSDANFDENTYVDHLINEITRRVELLDNLDSK